MKGNIVRTALVLRGGGRAPMGFSERSDTILSGSLQTLLNYACQSGFVSRNVTGEDEDIETGVNSLKTVGFINYYGLQRFGSLHVHTHHVGRSASGLVSVVSLCVGCGCAAIVLCALL